MDLENKLKKICDNLLKKGYLLCEFGLVNLKNCKFENDKYIQNDLIREPIKLSDTIIEGLKIIPEYYQKSKNFNYKIGSSYGLKHEIEKLFINKYMSNGQFIACSLLLDYNIKYSKDDEPNCYFNIKYISKQHEEKIIKIMNPQWSK